MNLIFLVSGFANATSGIEGLARKMNSVLLPSHLCETNYRGNSDRAAPIMFEGFPFDLSRHSCMFEGPFAVAGASVSTGGASSPMNVLAEASQIDHGRILIAEPGTASHQHIDRVLSLDPEKVRTVFAYDLFFWDSQGGSSQCAKSVQNVRKLLQWSKENRVNLVLGNIPEASKSPSFLMRSATCASDLNSAMEPCTSQEFCTLVDNKAKWKEIQENGGIRVGDEFFTPRDLRPDGLHFSRTGAIIAAELIASSIDKKPKNCD